MSFKSIRNFVTYFENTTPSTVGEDGILWLKEDLSKLYILIDNEWKLILGDIEKILYETPISITANNLEKFTAETYKNSNYVNRLHIGTDWQVAKDETFDILIYDVENVSGSIKNILNYYYPDLTTSEYDHNLNIKDISIHPSSFTVTTNAPLGFEKYHVASDFQIATDDLFENLVINKEELEMEKNEFLFYKKIIATPAIIIDNISIPSYFKVTTVSDITYNHVATDWQVATDEDFNFLIVDIQNSSEFLNTFIYNGE